MSIHADQWSPSLAVYYVMLSGQHTPHAPAQEHASLSELVLDQTWPECMLQTQLGCSERQLGTRCLLPGLCPAMAQTLASR